MISYPKQSYKYHLFLIFHRMTLSAYWMKGGKFWECSDSLDEVKAVGSECTSLQHWDARNSFSQPITGLERLNFLPHHTPPWTCVIADELRCQLFKRICSGSNKWHPRRGDRYLQRWLRWHLGRRRFSFTSGSQEDPRQTKRLNGWPF